jgi:hypothetical protein
MKIVWSDFAAFPTDIISTEFFRSIKESWLITPQKQYAPFRQTEISGNPEHEPQTTL